MRLVSRGSSGRASVVGMVADVTAGAPAGTVLGTLSFGGLAGTWAMAANDFFTVDAATGTIRASNTPTVLGQVYSPSVTFTSKDGGLDLTVKVVLTLTAVGSAVPFLALYDDVLEGFVFDELLGGSHILKE